MEKDRSEGNKIEKKMSKISKNIEKRYLSKELQKIYKQNIESIKCLLK